MVDIYDAHIKIHIKHTRVYDTHTYESVMTFSFKCINVSYKLTLRWSHVSQEDSIFVFQSCSIKQVKIKSIYSFYSSEATCFET